MKESWKKEAIIRTLGKSAIFIYIHLKVGPSGVPGNFGCFGIGSKSLANKNDAKYFWLRPISTDPETLQSPKLKQELGAKEFRSPTDFAAKLFCGSGYSLSVATWVN